MEVSGSLWTMSPRVWSPHGWEKGVFIWGEVSHGCSTFLTLILTLGSSGKSPTLVLLHFPIWGLSRAVGITPIFYRLNRYQWFCHLESSKLASVPKKLSLKFQIKGNKHFLQLVAVLTNIQIYQIQPIFLSEPTLVKSRISQSSD